MSDTLFKRLERGWVLTTGLFLPEVNRDALKPNPFQNSRFFGLGALTNLVAIYIHIERSTWNLKNVTQKT